MNGAVYLMDKPRGLTSRAASRLVAEAWGHDRFGHAGTLDPGASGVLPVLLGRATRLSSFLTGHRKTYLFELVPCVVTDTGDASGRVIESSSPEAFPGVPALRGVLGGLVGEMEQRVPRFSAVRIDGKRAYRLSRAGGEPEMPVRRVVIHSLEVAGETGRGCLLRAHVDPGTYIRALAVRIGELLGCGAHADGIVRESVGPFDISECSCEPDDPLALLSPARALRGYPSLRLDGLAEARILHGNALPSQAEGLVALLDSEGSRLLAVGRGDGRAICPMAVLEEP